MVYISNHLAAVTLNLNFTHACGYTCMPACLLHLKIQNLVCPCTVACNFGIRTRGSENTQHMHVTSSHLICYITHVWCTGTVIIAIGNEMYLFAAYQFLYML